MTTVYSESRKLFKTKLQALSMLEILFWLVIFIVSLIVLVKSADSFTSAAERIGVAIGIPSFLVGVTIVAFGTSLPELMSSVLAVIEGSSEIVVGNVVGSNIANILLVLGVAALLGGSIHIAHDIMRVDIPVLVASAFLLFLMVWDGQFTFWESLLCLAGIFIYLFYTMQSSNPTEPEKKLAEQDAPKKTEHRKHALKDWAIIGVGVIGLTLGAKYVVSSVLELSSLLGIGTEVIALVVVAFGTSLPELMATFMAARKGNAEIAVGNVLGSNVFNTFMVMGTSGLVAPLTVSGQLLIPASVISLAMPVMIVSTLLFVFMTQDKIVTKWDGWVLILFYIFFLISSFELL